MIRKAQLVFPCLLALVLWVAPAARADFGITPGSLTVTAEEEGGSLARRASSHPFAYTIQFSLNTDSQGKSEGGELRDVLFEVPPGLIGNPEAIEACPRTTFEETSQTAGCPPATQIGTVEATVAGLGVFIPLYDVVPPPGVPVQFGFSTKGIGFVGLQDASLRTEGGTGTGDYGVNVLSANIPVEVTQLSATIWGTPADPAHTAVRGPDSSGGGFPSEAPVLPFLTLPATCSEPLGITVKVDSKQNPGDVLSSTAVMRDAGGNPAALVGCDSVPFKPAISATPSTSAAESSSGLAFQLRLPNEGLMAPGSIVETEPVKTEVTLPAGIVANPAAAAGLTGCNEDQFRSASITNPGCPDGSKLGTLIAHTPLVKEAIEGSVYLASPHQNRFGSLLALYIVASAPERGILVKQAGEIHVDPSTGQLTTTFDGLPPIPYSSFDLQLREGPRAPLITPQVCGEYTTVARLYPFSAPGSPVERTAPFRIASGANGAGCAASEAQLPNKPSFEAGTLAPVAGAYSPFVFRVKRSDGDQPFSSVRASLPTGLLGKLKGVPYCPQPGIAVAASRTQEGSGAEELASPSCPIASQVGVVNVAAGAGPQPYNVQGKVYLAGPYKGAPLSLEIITPAIAGPFDLGSVAVRTALYVDPFTAQISAVSDPLPSILHGIPLDVRTISLQMDRPDFTLNPTNCSAKTVTGSVTSLVGQSALLSNPFAVGGCKGLDFGPNLALSLKGSTQRGKNPALKAVLTQPSGQANIAKVSVVLPKSEFIDNRHINNPCTRVQFNAGAGNGAQCPAKSILGYAKAWTPLLDKPLQGPVYFRSNGGERELPDLVASLDGQVHLNVVGFIDSVHKKGSELSRTRNTFAAVPDAPVSRFELELSGGKKGLLQNSANLCKVKNVATVKLSAQNGKTADLSAPIANGCKGKDKKKSGKGKGQKQHGKNEAKKTSLLRGLGVGW